MTQRYKPIKRRQKFGPEPIKIEIDHRPRRSILFLCAAMFISAIVLWVLNSANEKNQRDIQALQQQLEQIRTNNDRIERQIMDAIDAAKQVSTTPVTSGQASWLVYELPDTCAATRWPRGTELIVQSDNGWIKCVVRDYGPDPKIYPNRIVDLSLEQFSQLADPQKGVINVTIKAS